MNTLPDLQHTDGARNIAGIAEQHYVALIADILTFPRPLTTTGAGDSVTVSDPFVFKTGKCFAKLYSTLEEGELQDDAQGARDCQSQMVKGTLFFPGSDAPAVEVADKLKNSSLVFLIRENNGQLRIVGSPELPAMVKPSGKVGKKTSDSKGTTYPIEAPSNTPPFIYTGDVPLTPAT